MKLRIWMNDRTNELVFIDISITSIPHGVGEIRKLHTQGYIYDNDGDFVLLSRLVEARILDDNGNSISKFSPPPNN